MSNRLLHGYLEPRWQRLLPSTRACGGSSGLKCSGAGSLTVRRRCAGAVASSDTHLRQRGASPANQRRCNFSLLPPHASYSATIVAISARDSHATADSTSHGVDTEVADLLARGTEKSAMTRIISSCNTRRCGRNVTRSHSGKPVSWRSSVAESMLVKGARNETACTDAEARGTCDWIPGFHGPKLMPTA